MRNLLKNHSVFHSWLVLLLVLMCSDVVYGNEILSDTEPFFGVWCGASKTQEEAFQLVQTMKDAGFSAKVLISSEWSNLNDEFWYVITAGIYSSEDEANAALSTVVKIVPDAYIKYSGTFNDKAEKTGNLLEKKISGTADALDGFLFELLMEAYSMGVGEHNTENCGKYVSNLYAGTLTDMQKSMIAAGKATPESYFQHYGVEIGVIPLYSVKDAYRDLFGITDPQISLPIVDSYKDTDEYYMGYADDGKGNIYRLSFETEAEMDVELLSVKKVSSGDYVVQKEYRYYSYWGFKKNGAKPDIILIATIYLNENAGTRNGYCITGITLETQ